MNLQLSMRLVNFVTRIADSQSSLWILTREAKVTKREAKDILEALRKDVPKV